ncbi:MAG: DUF1259 domain-containing protein [Methyloceanibacter sp.]
MRIAVLGMLTIIGCVAAIGFAPAEPSKLDTGLIECAIGLKGSYSEPENVFKVTKPRDDISVEVDGWRMPSFMGLTSWAAFTPTSQGESMVMGDIVLLQDEVNPAMSAALDSGLEVTALHNHFFFDKPKVFFMHIGGTGEASNLATGVKKVLDAAAAVRSANSVLAESFPGYIPSQNAISARPLETVLGKGQAKDGMFKVVIGRETDMHGTKIGKEMGVNTWAAFAGTDAEAVVDGDFAMQEDELQRVLRAMRKEGLNVVAIHQHMAREAPRYMFLHYWGKGNALDLAHSLKRVLEAQGGKDKSH